MHSGLGSKLKGWQSAAERGTTGARAAAGAKRHSVGIATLLVALVLIPLSGMTALGIAAVASRQTTAVHARHIDESLPRVDALIALRQALYSEQAVSGVRLRETQLRQTPPAAGFEFDLDAGETVASARAATDTALTGFTRTRLPMMLSVMSSSTSSMTSSTATATATLDWGALRSLRDEIDSGTTDAADAEQGYATLEGQLDVSLHSLVERMVSMIVRVNGGYRVWAALEALDGARERSGAAVAKAARTVHAAASSLVSATAADYRDWLLGLLALVLATIFVTLAVARFITLPIRRLAERARAVSGGRLDVEFLPTAGPKETGVVAAAFDELVSNLRLLEAKSQALSSCDFDNPALNKPLPGRLGRTIENSVRVLSGSIEERAKLQDSLEHQATHDALTGLYNRAAAVNVLEHALARARRTGDALAVLYVDLDDFKRANDNHGHNVGDQILQEVGARMKAVARGGDVLARLGGDEFLVLAEHIGDAGQAGALARRLINAIAVPVQCEGLRFTVGACVGVAMALDGHEGPGQLLAHADLALYRAKARGRANIEIYDKSLQDELRQRDDIEQALTLALSGSNDELVLHYQPVIDGTLGRVTELEALIRWQRPGSSLLAPGEFIPVAEASDLIIDLDVWVLHRVAEQIARWSAHPEFADVAVAVNISGRHLLSQRLARHLHEVLAETDIDPRHLIFEITETVLLADLPTAADELAKVRAQGVRVAIDDFGTGYTSIAHLQNLPIDAIKIDRSFVSEVDQPRDQSLVRMVTDLSHNIGVEVVAEGVETLTQRDVLVGLGCDNLQGFLISRPVPATEIVEWMQAQPARSAAGELRG